MIIPSAHKREMHTLYYHTVSMVFTKVSLLGIFLTTHVLIHVGIPPDAIRNHMRMNKIKKRNKRECFNCCWLATTYDETNKDTIWPISLALSRKYRGGDKQQAHLQIAADRWLQTTLTHVPLRLQGLAAANTSWSRTCLHPTTIFPID